MAERKRRDPRPTPEPLGPTQAFEIATRFLATRPRTRWEVARRLGRAGAAPDVAEQTLDRLADLGLVDDASFARWWHDQRDRHRPRGRRLIEAELRAKGVSSSVLELLRDTEPQRLEEDAALPATEVERAAAALEGHLRGRPLPTDPKGLQRMGMFLVRRGFDPATARATIRAHAEESAAANAIGPEEST